MNALKVFVFCPLAYRSVVHKSQAPGYPWWLNFVCWHQIFVGPQYGTCFMLPFWQWNFEVAPGYLKICANLLQVMLLSLNEYQAKSMQYFAHGNM